MDPKEPLKEAISDSNVFSQSTNGFSKVRKLLLKSAINYLTDPRLQFSANVDQKLFLARKGLNRDEIDLAYEIATELISKQNISDSFFHSNHSSSFLSKYSQIILKILLCSGTLYFGYLFYTKKYKNLFKVKLNQSDDAEEEQRSLNEMTVALYKLNEQIQKLNSSFETIKEFYTQYGLSNQEQCERF
ncbi:hypothetical protein SSS_05032 [Sarcoptes scabiei]|uniref:Peroxin-14 n=1 Tax=Sarcoptes scabiei TaxID=52283 RepID=A0A834RAL5_SARSC|nr:hypothetical protein SSS_05032 [Sarcoptes scabiei]